MEPNTVGRAGMTDTPAGQFTHPIPRDAGLITGALVLTLDGELPVEFLSPGDRVITRDQGMACISTISHTSIEANAIVIKASAFGAGRPQSDVLVAGGQLIHLRNWRALDLFGKQHGLVRADGLIDGHKVRDYGLHRLDLFQITCEAPHVLYADGLELGTSDATGDVKRASAA